VSASDPEGVVKRRRISALATPYRFELIVLLTELVAIGVVGLTLWALFAPLQGKARADARFGRLRPSRLARVPAGIPARVQPNSPEPVEIYITVTELPTPEATPRPERTGRVVPRRDEGDSAGPPLTSPLTDWPVAGRVT
jgi:hypothetical protein